MLAPTLVAFWVRVSFNARRVSAWDGAPRSDKSIWAVRTCCTVGAALGPDGAEIEEKLDAEGEEGVGLRTDNSLRYVLRVHNQFILASESPNETHMASFARGGLLLFVLLPRVSNG